MIEAQIVAHSKHSLFNVDLVTMVCTFPRIILAEVNTHRMFTRNSASSRAIPFNKMVESVKTNPFIPSFFQKDHSGMQGSKYIEARMSWDIRKKQWLEARDAAVAKAIEMHTPLSELYKDHPEFENYQWEDEEPVTKQICNRLLEPFMFHTAIITTSEIANFFALRCPSYNIGGDYEDQYFRSIKEVMSAVPDFGFELSDLGWQKLNKGLAEIHMMALAEAMYNAYTNIDRKIKILEPGQWHIPYEDKILEMFPGISDTILDKDGIPQMAKIGCVMAARTSYTVVGTEMAEWTPEKYAIKCDELTNSRPLHASPFEHTGPAMTKEQWYNHVRGIIPDFATILEGGGVSGWTNRIPESVFGWSGNIRGFIQYRKMLPFENITEL